MLSECARGVFCVAEVKPSRWVYIMNLIGVLASKWKYLWYLHLETLDGLILNLNESKSLVQNFFVIIKHNDSRHLWLLNSLHAVTTSFIIVIQVLWGTFELPNLSLIVIKDYGTVPSDTGKNIVWTLEHWRCSLRSSCALDIVHSFGQSALSPLKTTCIYTRFIYTQSLELPVWVCLLGDSISLQEQKKGALLRQVLDDLHSVSKSFL